MAQKDDIRLRAPEPEDVDFLYKLENDRKLWHLSNTLTPFSRFDLEQFIMLSDKDIFATRQARFIIEFSSGQNMIPAGAVDLFDFEPTHKRAGVGIIVVEEERKKGIASQALDLIIDYAFGILGLHQLYCNISEGNEASIRLFTAAGFEITGRKKEWNNRQGNWEDELLLQLVHPE